MNDINLVIDLFSYQKRVISERQIIDAALSSKFFHSENDFKNEYWGTNLPSNDYDNWIIMSEDYIYRNKVNLYDILYQEDLKYHIIRSKHKKIKI